MEYEKYYKTIKDHYKDKLLSSGLIYRSEDVFIYFVELINAENERYCEIASVSKIDDKFSLRVDFKLNKLDDKFDRIYHLVKASFRIGAIEVNN